MICFMVAQIIIRNIKYKVLLATKIQEWKDGLKRARFDLVDGLLMVFENDRKVNITMIGMSCAIDILWIDANKNIIKIEEKLSLFDKNNQPNRIEGVLCRYVVELKAGEVEKNNFLLKDKLKF